MADRLSGEEDLYTRLAPAEGGFGRYHKQLKYRPFVIGSDALPITKVKRNYHYSYSLTSKIFFIPN